MKIHTRLPIWLSAFGFPGLGQFVQKRWIAGLIFSSGFLVGFFWVMAIAVHNIIELYAMAFTDRMPEPIPVSAFTRPLLIVAVVYLISLFDVFRAQQRILSRQHEETFLKANETPDS
ncbi:hypothetical protein [Pontiella sp.]|uniref:hypothetical protein n=1 Tax=Pontiella sp. TaxID=2837462 RepID=UPI00356799CE